MPDILHTPDTPDIEEIVILKIIQEALGESVDLDIAVALTYILNHKLLYVNKNCYEGLDNFRTPLDMTLRYSCDIVCRLQINGTNLPIVNYNSWMRVWHERYGKIYKTNKFQEDILKIINLLVAHPCIDKIEES
ncbi:MAG: hypothetical protein ABI690_15870 [Chloroflexota bacterium]